MLTAAPSSPGKRSTSASPSMPIPTSTRPGSWLTRLHSLVTYWAIPSNWLPRRLLSLATAIRSMAIITTSERVRRRSSVIGGCLDQLSVLPSAVLIQIFETVALASKRDICSVSRLNRRYHGVADAVLYKTVHFPTPELHFIFGQSLSRRPRRGSAIQEIKIAYPASDLSGLVSTLPSNSSTKGLYGKPWSSDSLADTISAMSNLETLDVAVPLALQRGIGQLFNGPFDLTCLKTCHLFYQCPDDEFWDLQENIHIFAHPTLETLVIRKARLGDKPFDLPDQPEATGLRKLHLIDCDISDDGLYDLMHFPSGLTEFVMTQSPEPGPDLEETSDSIRDYFIAIEPQCHSLETITIENLFLQDRRALQLRSFEKLKTLRLSWDYQLFGHSSKKPRLTSAGIPPNLETLEFFNPVGTDGEVTDLFVAMLQNLSVTASKLTHLIVMEDDPDEDPLPKEVEEACKAQKQLHLDIIGRMDTVDCGDEENEETEAEASM